MKIINSTTRDATDEIKKTPITSLGEATTLNENSLLHIVQYLESNKGYQSMRMTAKTFQNKVYEAVNNTFKVMYWDIHDGHGNMSLNDPKFSFGDMISYINNETLLAKRGISELEAASSEYGFLEHIDYDFEVLRRYVVLKELDIQDQIDDIVDDVNGIDCQFTGTMTITTRDKDGETTSESVNHLKTDNDTYAQMSISDGNKISNEWTVPASGNLVVYGWLDSSAALNSKSIPSAFCVIEGKINGADNWEIIGVQPVIPAKTITYVGFNIPVKSGLVIRARTGFVVGGKSGAYSKEQDGNDSLSNSVVNGFKCQVFSRKDEE